MRLFSQDVKVEALKRTPLFEGLTKKELGALASATDDLQVEPAGTGHDPDPRSLDHVPDGQHVRRGRCYPVSPMRRPASSSTGRRIASISANCSGPAIRGGESWMTGSPRSSARQISPRSYSSAER